MKVKCIGKVRDDKGNIKYYNLMKENGIKFQATAKDIKVEMSAGNYEFINLQIDKAGRLIDKKLDEVKQPVLIQEDIKNSIKKLIQHLLNNGGFKCTSDGQIVSVNINDIKYTYALMEKLKAKLEKTQLENIIYSIVEEIMERKDIYFGYIGDEGLIRKANLFISHNENTVIDLLKSEYEEMLWCANNLDNMKVDALRSLMHTNIENKNFNSVDVTYEDNYLDQLNRALDNIEKEVLQQQ